MNISYHDYRDQNVNFISIITVLFKCAEDVQKVPTHKSLQVLFFFLNQQTTNKMTLFA